MMERSIHSHPFSPVFDSDSRILILGSFPSVRSREEGFYYMHPQNRFWKMLSAFFHEKIGDNKEEKTEFLLSHCIALWDSISSCSIVGSSDASLRDAVPNDIASLLVQTNVQSILCNGAASYRIYNTYVLPKTGVSALSMPSTSAANASFSLEKLCAVWHPALLTALTDNAKLIAKR